MPATDKPIGYWVKHLHNLLETLLDAPLSDERLSRRHWQTLNLLSQSDRTVPELEQALRPFWEEGAIDLATVLDGPDGLVTRGWVETSGEALSLTEEGRAGHAHVADRVNRARRLVLDGLSPEQYVETVQNLSVMTENVERFLAGARS
ncbi:MarR family transcriptional regulator [Sphaerisporangium fuscum]|uniref:MarR family transcriptional regulator n=1 Tax=Sphaerisporangium fuscum TaxID=2835868 RepID=UPI001BDBC7D0|nr:MarR family transcriptional regulator [Sphaerisporangium fuscum]